MLYLITVGRHSIILLGGFCLTLGLCISKISGEKNEKFSSLEDIFMPNAKCPNVLI